ncbi:MAG TPA: hypothetical protein VMW29_00695, partial [Candidatus Bathyarchaeia archaeon]|nr:hypothetical protein [Candidatus Bathyarchaeia archaeon]
MIQVKRYSSNPILSFNQSKSWEAEAAFNGSITKKGNKFFLVYRAVASPQFYYGSNIKLSSIGLAESPNGFAFKNRHQFITPEYSWERFGCEDPRVTKLGSKYYIFYTALSDYPPS